MTAKRVEREVTSQLAQTLVGTGFREKNNDLLAQRLRDGEAQIRCAVRKDKGFGTMWVTLMLGVRFDEVETLLGRTDPDRPTLGTPIYSLHHDGKLMEWDTDSRLTLYQLADQVKTYAIPFFERFCRLDAVFEALRSENPANWFWLGTEGRIQTLAAIMTLRGDKDSALALLEREILAKGGSSRPPDRAMRLRLQSLRERLAKC